MEGTPPGGGARGAAVTGLFFLHPTMASAAAMATRVRFKAGLLQVPGAACAGEHAAQSSPMARRIQGRPDRAQEAYPGPAWPGPPSSSLDERPRAAALAALAAAVEACPETEGVPVRFCPPGPGLHAAVLEAAQARPRRRGVVDDDSRAPRGRRGRSGSSAAPRGPPTGSSRWPAAPIRPPTPGGCAGPRLRPRALGEGEETLVGLLRRLAGGGDPRGPGLAWKEAGGLRRGPAPPPVSWTLPPFPRAPPARAD